MQEKMKGIFRSALHSINKIKSYQNNFLEIIFEFFSLSLKPAIKHSFKMTVSRRQALTILLRMANNQNYTRNYWD